MSIQGEIKRYTLIIECLKNPYKPYPSLKDIITHIKEDGIRVSERTLQRCFVDLGQFGVEIVYHHGRRGYFIENVSEIDALPLMHIMELANTASMVMESMKDGTDNIKYLSFDMKGSLKGTHHFQSLLKAIREKRKIKIVHQSFTRDEPGSYLLHPYMLKEYQNRWYLIAKFDDTNAVRSFGIDRIEKVDIQIETYQPDLRFDPELQYLHVIGIEDFQEDPVFVGIEATKSKAKYFKTLPIHHSQKLITEDEDTAQFEFFIKPTNEFLKRILSFGPAVRIIHPEFVVDKMKNMLNAMIVKYD